MINNIYHLENAIKKDRINPHDRCIVVRKRSMISADSIEGYEAYVSDKHWWFETGSTPNTAIDNLKIWYREHKANIDRLPVRMK